jgi:transposase
MASARRYPSDLTDEQWELIESLLPKLPRGPAGRPRTYGRREIVNAIFYLNRSGCSWRMLPSDLPYWKTVYHYFRLWRTDGTLDRIHDALRKQVRIKEGREAKPTAGIVDSQSVKGADTVGKGTRGYDAGNHAGRAVMPGWVSRGLLHEPWVMRPRLGGVGRARRVTASPAR